MLDKRKIGDAAAMIGVIAAASAALMVLAGGPGARFGLWSQRLALQMLAWAAYAAVGGGVLGLIGAVMGGARVLAIAAIVVSLAVFAVPWQFKRTAASVPFIHDVTTDTDDPPAFVALVKVRADAKAMNPPEYAGPETAALQKQGYPDLAPIVLAEPPTRAFERASEAARSMGWEIVAAEPRDGRIEATATTPWFGFKDDVVVRVRPEGSGSRVDVRSKSRIGRSDIGANAARIRKFRSALGK